MSLMSLSPAQYRGFIHFFNNYQNSGMLGKKELAAILSKSGIHASDEELQQMIDAISIDSHGIGLQAFVGYVSSWKGFRDQEQEYAEAFRIYDRDGSGELDEEEMHYVMSKLGSNASKGDIENMLSLADKNHDGKIQYDEFIALMTKRF